MKTKKLFLIIVPLIVIGSYFVIPPSGNSIITSGQTMSDSTQHAKGDNMNTKVVKTEEEWKKAESFALLAVGGLFFHAFD